MQWNVSCVHTYSNFHSIVVIKFLHIQQLLALCYYCTHWTIIVCLQSFETKLISSVAVPADGVWFGTISHGFMLLLCSLDFYRLFIVFETEFMVSGTAQFFLATKALLILSVLVLYFVHLLLLMCSVIQRGSSWLMVYGVALLHLLVDSV